jgi:hypothetical protein
LGVLSIFYNSDGSALILKIHIPEKVSAKPLIDFSRQYFSVVESQQPVELDLLQIFIDFEYNDQK